MTSRPAAGGGRWIDVAPARLERWLTDFHARHDVVRTDGDREVVRFTGADGAVAECHPSFPPLAQAAGDQPGFHPEALLSDARARRVVGVVLVRAGGHAAGVFDGTELVASKVGSRLVHGRNAAGGWSQQRFARRREGQLREAYSAAAADAARVLLPHLDRLDAVVRGGDRRALDVLAQDSRLGPVFARATERILSVPDPKLTVLRQAPEQFLAVRIRLLDPASPS